MPRIPRVVYGAMALSAGYYLGALVGFTLTPAPQPVSTLWPPNAIVLGALLVAAPRWWWVLLLAVFPAHLLVQLRSAVPLPMALSWYVSNCSEALIGAAGVRWFVGGPLRIDSVRRVGIFVAVGAVGAPFLSSFLDAGLVEWNDFGVGTYWEIWSARFFSNVLAILAVTPVILAAAGGRERLAFLRRAPIGRVVEVLVLGAALLAVSIAIFAAPNGATREAPALLFTPMPLLLWAAVRFGSEGTSTSLLMLALVSIWGAIHGLGPFAMHPVKENVLSLQLFLIGAHVPLLTLAAVIQERSRAEQEARRNEQRLNLALSAAQMGIWDWTLAGRRAWRADETPAPFGLTEALVSADRRHPFAHVFPEDRAMVQAAFNAAIDQGAPLEVEFRVEHPDGAVRWVLSKGMVVRDGSGRSLRVMGVNADVTERKLAEAVLRDESTLRESEARLREMADAMPQIVYSARADGALEHVNRKWNELTRLAPGPGDDGSWLEMIHPDDQAKAVESWAVSVRAGTPHQLELRLWSAKEREFRWHLSRALPVRDSSGRVVRWYGTSTDIHDQKRVEQALRDSEAALRSLGEALEHRVAERTAELAQANEQLRAEIAVRERTERALRASEERFAKAFAASPDAISITHQSGSRVLEVNERWELMFGYPRAEAIGQSLDALGIFADAADARAFNALMVSQGSVREFEVELRSREGIPLRGVLAGEVVEVVGESCVIIMIRDITESRRAEGEVVTQRRQLAHLGRVALVGELSGALAHDLNQPLAAILANARAAERLLDSGRIDDATLRSILHDIVADDRRAGDVIRRIRALIRKGDAELQEVIVNELVTDVLDIARSDLLQREVAVTTNLSPALPVVSADRVQLQQVLLNLIVNAADAMADATPAERLMTITTADDADTVRLTVADQGPGLPPNAVEVVFEPFVTTKEHGLGLGLAICRSIVSAHGGRMWATNNAGRGATFHVLLPRARSPSGDGAASPA
jgi:PAS domain S-box-containing protein